MSLATPGSAPSYTEFAPYYDDFTADHDYDVWTSVIARLAGLEGRTGRLLDVGCGTGKSFLPFARRGWHVTAVDTSADMARIAAAKWPAADVRVIDARKLDLALRADLVLALDDVLNYQESDADVQTVVAGLIRHAAPGGVVVADTNTHLMYERHYLASRSFTGDRGDYRWSARRCGDFYEAELHARADDGAEVRELHRQRHVCRAFVEAAFRAAGAECVAVHGMDMTGHTDPEPDERRHTKLLYVATKERR